MGVKLLTFEVNKISIVEAIDYYLENESKARKTFKNYKTEIIILNDLKVFLRLKYEMDLKKTCLYELRSFHIMHFQNWLFHQQNKLNGAKISPSTVNRKMNTVRNFFSRAEFLEWIFKNPCKGLKPLKEEKEYKRPWTELHYQTVLGELKGLERDLFIFLWETGARLSTGIRFKMSHAVFDEGFMLLETRKGNINKNIYYKVPISKKLNKVLKHYKYNNQPFAKVNAGTFSKRIQRILKRNKLNEKGITLHSVRHTFATRLVANGVNIDIVRRLLGHSNLKTTQEYLLFSDSDIKKAFE